MSWSDLRVYARSLIPSPTLPLVVLALWACILSPTVLAALAIYGPEPFVQIPGPAQTRTVLFDAPVPGPGYTLLLHNGDADSSPTTRANRAEVWLNGEQLVGRGNFLPITRELEIPVVLATTNELSVRVKGGAGRYLTLEILSLPVADAGPDQAAAVGDLVTLDAGGSWDLGGGPLSYSWELTAQPAGSTSVLSDAGSIRPILDIDRPGDYRARLSVSDGSYESEPDQILVSTFNTPPRADAGPDQSLPVGAVAYLDAGGSQDAEGDLLGFAWTLTAVPAGSSTALRFADTPNPEFDLDLAGRYQVELSVDDGRAAGAPDRVVVSTGNVRPLADAGPDLVVPLDEPAGLDASRSRDANGDLLSYRWDLLSAPALSTAAISADRSLQAELRPDLPGYYAVQLLVTDGIVDSRPDTLVLTATDNLRPIAVAGGPWQGAAGRELLLDGSDSYDPEGEPLTYLWTLTEVPVGSGTVLAGRNSARPSLVPDLAGIYKVSLQVDDGELSSHPDLAEIIVVGENRPPAADAGADRQVGAPELVYLDGSASSDPDGDSLSYHWRWVSKPADSGAWMLGTDTVSPVFQTDRPGAYEVELVVDDGVDLSGADAVIITTRSVPPEADAGPDRLVSLGDLVTLDGSASVDPDGDPIIYTWTLISAPAGSSAAIANADQALAQLVPDLEGQYAARLSVADAGAEGSSDVVLIDVAQDASNHPPTIQSSAPVSAVTLEPFSYAVAAVDPDGDPLVFSLAEAPQDMRIDPELGLVSWTPLASGYTVVIVEANDGRGGVARQEFLLQVETPVGDLPPAPQDLAPPLTETGVTPFVTAIEFLYGGASPIQVGVDPEMMDPERVGVVRGRVLDRAGNALPGVKVGFKGHPEYGQTLSRADGGFDLAANGADLVLVYQKDGYLPVRRTVRVPWRDYVHAPEVVLVALDPKVTRVDLRDTSRPFQFVTGSQVVDEAGSRQAALLFPAGTGASMTLSDGTVQPLTSLDVRATEYTQGETGPQAMPGELPEESAYTYAVELSVDEAIAAGATRVDFDQAVTLLVDNFLDFPVGERVPLGWYDREQARWIAADDGRIIEILGVSGGLAQVDVDGSGTAADAGALAVLGIDDAERAQLAEQYEPGKSLWRVSITHFTPWDCNWPYGLPVGAQSPPSIAPTNPYGEADVAALDIPIEGTPYSLHYSSDRMAGGRFTRSLSIPLSGTDVPDSLLRIDLRVEVAGQLFEQSFSPLADQTYLFTWDGKDGYGRDVNGARKARVEVEYVYDLIYYAASAEFEQSFAQVGDGTIIGQRNTSTARLNRGYEMVLENFRNNSAALGGLSVDVHHAYDPVFPKTYYGNGESFGAVGEDAPAPLSIPLPGVSPFSQTVGPDGSLYFFDTSTWAIYRLYLNGNISKIAGGIRPPSYSPSSPDGTPALEASLNLIDDIKIGPTGDIIWTETYVVSTGTRPSDGTTHHRWISRIRTIDGEGRLRTIAGNTDAPLADAASSDGRFATDFDLGNVSDIAFDSDFNLHFAAVGAIWKLDNSGRLKLLQEVHEINRTDCIDCRGTEQSEIWGIVVSGAGDVYYSYSSAHKVVRIMPDGSTGVIAGNGKAGYSGDFGPAVDAQMFYPTNMVIIGNEFLVVAENFASRLRVVELSTGIIVPLSGTITSTISRPGSVSVDAAGNIYVVQLGGERKIFKFSFSEADYIGYRRISPDGSEFHDFDQNGRHWRTIDTQTGEVLYSFHYHPEGRLETITDANDEVTSIERDEFGTPLAIIAPKRKITLLQLDAYGHLSTIAGPTATHLLDYEAGGLLIQYQPPSGPLQDFYYDSLGRLRDGPPPGGGHVGDDLPDLPPDTLSVPDTSELVGSIGGSFAVSPGGGASYTVPIAVPPGTGGVQPKLNLSYSSQAGNGVMGVGWSLSGLSMIHRCAQNLAQDGKRNAVSFTATDRFCLDGSRLMPADGVYADYGRDGKEYRTEIDVFSKIVSYGNQGGAPAWFKVWTKSGEIMEYGVSADARLEAEGRADNGVQRWGLSKLSDTAGNYLTVQYDEDVAEGRQLPLRIYYTGNAGEGVAPYASVRFEYQDRPDASVGYLAGSRIVNRSRLAAVSSYDGSTLVRRYAFDYHEPSFANPFSRLSQVRACVDAAETQCLAPTQVEWQTAESGFGPQLTHEASHELRTGGMDTARALDFNGDGISDLAYAKDLPGRVFIDLFDHQGLVSQQLATGVFMGQSGKTGNKMLVLDYEGDGDTEILVPHFEQYVDASDVWVTRVDYWTLIDFVGNAAVTSQINIPGLSDVVGLSMPIALDVNGDALHDLFWSGRLLLNMGNGFSLVTGAGVPTGNMNKFRVIDANGDGMHDLFYVNNVLYLSNGNGFSVKGVNWHEPDAEDVSFTIDINGDGYQDLLWFDEQELQFRINQAGSNYQGTCLPSDSCAFGPLIRADVRDLYGNMIGIGKDENAAYARPMDYNNDGMIDLLVPRDGSPNWLAFVARRDPASGVRFEAYDTGVPKGDGYYHNPQVADFNGDGLTDLLYPTGRKWHVRLRAGQRGDLVTRITAGAGRFDDLLEIDYAPLTAPGVHAKSSDADTPVQRDFQGPLYVVTETREDNGVGGLNAKTYGYEGAKIDTQGRGQLGFAVQTVTDQTNGRSERLELHQQFPHIGAVRARITSTPTGLLLNRVTNSLAAKTLGTGGLRVFPYVESSIAKTYDPVSGARVSTQTTENTYGDAYGNLTKMVAITEDVTGTYTKTTENLYVNNLSDWLLGRLASSQITHEGGQFGPSVQVRHSGFGYQAGTGLLNLEKIETGEQALNTAYGLDEFGNRESVTVSGPGIANRTSSTVYDAQGRYPEYSENALGHRETYEYADPFGNRTALTGPNGLTTRWEYDPLGRQTGELRADGTETVSTYAWCNDACPDARAVYRLTVQTTGAPGRIVYFDQRDREILSASESFDGRLVYVETRYDARGRKRSVSRPYYQGELNGLASYDFDNYDRLIEQFEPDSGRTTISYAGLTVTQINALGQETVEEQNALGHTLRTRDADGYWTRFDYDAVGNLTRVTDPEGNVTVNQYNLRGERTASDDPDMGAWSYEYNALGELTGQTDAKGQRVEITYDKLGRMISRQLEGDTASLETWAYDDPVHGKAIGKLTRETGPGGFARNHHYDDLGRPQRVETSIAGEPFISSLDYDSASRVEVIHYPGGQNLAVRNAYNSFGHLEQVLDDTSGALHWQGTAANADGNFTEETLGGVTSVRFYDSASGRIRAIDTGAGEVQNLEYVFDDLGNLIARNDLRPGGSSEDFDYDNHNRLRQITTTVAGISALSSLDYDPLGNITSKDGVGYGYDSARPHAVVSAGGIGYRYDANGNLSSDDRGRSLTWSYYNKPLRITQGGTEIRFDYGPDRARYRKVHTSAGQTQTTVYLGDLYERIKTPGLTEHRHYIQAGGSKVAVDIRRSSASDEIRYLHRDHLGSVDTITDARGQILERNSYDAWGLRRQADWSDPLDPVTSIESRGFTGHEHLDDVGLIHMNGRVYDPQLGRFLSADPFVQFPKNLQSLNRYSYVLNNPLSYTDPSGYFVTGLIAIAASVIGSEAGAAAAGYLVEAYGISAAAASVIEVAVGNLVTATLIGTAHQSAGGTFADGFQAGLNGSSISRSGSEAPSSLVASGSQMIVDRDVSHYPMGGDFAELPLDPPGFGMVGGDLANFLASGTGSELSGRKFENGAATEAWGYAYVHQSSCIGSCHGNEGTVGRPMTPMEELILDLSTLIIPSGWGILRSHVLFRSIRFLPRVARNADDILVLGRGTPQQLQKYADAVGGRVINNASLASDRKALFGHIHREMRRADKIIQVMDGIPKNQVIGRGAGQWARAEKMFLDQNAGKFEKKLRRVRRQDLINQ